MGSDCGRLRRPQRGKGHAVLERYLSILVPLLRCAQPVVTEGTDAWGVVHERNLSIKQDKKCAEPAGGP